MTLTYVPHAWREKPLKAQLGLAWKMENSTLFSPPNTVKGIKILNREEFKTVISLPALRIEAKKCSLFLKNLSHCLLNQPRMRNIVPASSGTTKKILLLHPQKPLKALEEPDRNFAENHGGEETTYELILGYEHWTAEQVLRAVLPADVSEVPSSFETIGHIAHVNLRDSQLDYRKLIGKWHRLMGSISILKSIMLHLTFLHCIDRYSR